MGILVPGITYEAGQGGAVTDPPTIFRLASPFMRGETVRRIQQALKEARVDPGTIDGIFGPKTKAAVLGFQLEKGLVPDGEVGPETAVPLGIEI